MSGYKLRQSGELDEICGFYLVPCSTKPDCLLKGKCRCYKCDGKSCAECDDC